VATSAKPGNSSIAYLASRDTTVGSPFAASCLRDRCRFQPTAARFSHRDRERGNYHYARFKGQEWCVGVCTRVRTRSFRSRECVTWRVRVDGWWRVKGRNERDKKRKRERERGQSSNASRDGQWTIVTLARPWLSDYIRSTFDLWSRTRRARGPHLGSFDKTTPRDRRWMEPGMELVPGTEQLFDANWDVEHDLGNVLLYRGHERSLKFLRKSGTLYYFRILRRGSKIS